MADVLLELGSANGHSPRSIGQISRGTPVADLFDLVKGIENPLVGIYAPGDPIPQDVLSISARIRAISERNRLDLGKQFRVSLDGRSLRGVESVSLELGIAEMDELGKSIFKKAKKAAKKAIGKAAAVVKSPAFLGVVAIGAAFIPGLGIPAASAIGSVAQLSAKAAAEKKTAAAQKKREAAEAVALENPELAAQLMAEADKLDRQAEAALQQGQMAQQAAALGIAAGLAIPGAADKASEFLNALPKPLQLIAGKLAPGLSNDIKTAGVENFFGTAMKGVGQMVGFDQLAKGAGVSEGVGKFFGGAAMNEVIGRIQESSDPAVRGAIKAGIADVETMGAVGGVNLSDAISSGAPSKFPVLAVVGVAAGVIIVSVVLLR